MPSVALAKNGSGRRAFLGDVLKSLVNAGLFDCYCNKSEYIVYYCQLLNNFSSSEICLSDEDGKHLDDAKETSMKTKIIGLVPRKVSYADELVDSEAAAFHVLGELFRDGVIATTGYRQFCETPCVKPRPSIVGTTYERWVQFFIPEWYISQVSEVHFQLHLTNTRWQAHVVSVRSWPLEHSDQAMTMLYLKVRGKWISEVDNSSNPASAKPISLLPSEDAYWELFYQLLACRVSGSGTFVTSGPRGRDSDEIFISREGRTLAVFQLSCGGVKCFVGENPKPEFVSFADTTRLLEIIKQFNTKK